MRPLDLIASAGVEALIRLVRSMPLEHAQRWSAALARRVFDREGRHVQFALENLRIAYPDLSEDERRAIGRESYVHLVWNQLDWARATAWGDDEITARVEIKGLENVHDALAKGRGVFAISLHMGAFELAIRAVPLRGVPLSVVGRPLDNQRLYERITAERTRTGAETIERHRGALSMLRALRANRVVGVLLDQYARSSQAGIYVPMFGARCSTSSGVAILALRSNVPVLSFHIWRDAPDHHQLVIGPPIDTPRTDDNDADIEAATTRYNEVLEGLIRCHPEQWVWAHRRFRRSPDLPDLRY